VYGKKVNKLSLWFIRGTQALRLKIIDAETRPDQVEFVETFKLNGKAHKMRENSRFVFENGHWFYLGTIEVKGL
jgi:uncharacterized protein YchJ